MESKQQVTKKKYELEPFQVQDINLKIEDESPPATSQSKKPEVPVYVKLVENIGAPIFD